jgi:holo-[acyl-carrier protein] synthase
MIKGIGIDIVNISRIGKMPEERHKRFCRRVFSETELQNIEKVKIKNENRAFQKAAGYFAAKEAFLKALGIGLFSIPLNKIEVLNDENGQPYIELNGNFTGELPRLYGGHPGHTVCLKKVTGIKSRILDLSGISSIKVSITHDGGFACAVVAVEVE